MGGDLAPGEIVAGAWTAHEGGAVDVLLVGPTDPVRAAAEAAGAKVGEGFEIVEAPETIPMDDPDPARAVRAKRNASVSVAARLVKDGRADAFFSAGATGAALAAGVLHTGRIRGIARPGIATVLPFPGAATVLLDAGANADSRPDHLAGFAMLGSVFAEVSLGIAEPRVGLLSVGEEPGKGNELVKEAYPLIEALGLRFVGNIEGRDIPAGAADVVVTDGFTGNVVLKLLEGFSKFLMEQLLELFDRDDQTRKAADVLLPGLLELRSALSPDTYGGAQLLGVKGVCIIGHGSSNAGAVRAAMAAAVRAVDGRLVERVSERLER